MHARLSQYVTIETRKCIRAKAIGKKVVSADTLIQNADVSVNRRSLKPLRKNVGPTVIAVGRGSVPVRD
jgi:hypothetical protein